jgi:GAF domain-containing protein
MNTKKRVIPYSTSRAEDVQVWRQRTLRGMLYGVAAFGAVALIVALSQVQDPWMIPIYVGVYVGLLVITFWRRVPYSVQGIVVLSLVYVMGVFGLLEDGLSGDGRVFLLTLPLLAILLYGRREGILTLALALVTLAAFGWAFSTGGLSIQESFGIYSGNWQAWLSGTLVFLVLGVLIVISQGQLVPDLIRALTQSRELVQELEETHDALRERAEGLEAARRLLEERTRALQANAEVAKEAVSVLNLPALLERIVALISARFGYYHTGIYLLDSTGEWAELQAASSEGGQQMVAQGHRLHVSSEGIVGRAIGEGSHRMMEATDQAAWPLSNELPGTRAQIALPLRARGTIIGALDVQSQESAAFDDEQVTVLQALADQVAIAISNARLFQQVQESLEAERQAYGKMSASAWQEVLRARPTLGQRYDPQGILPTDRQWRAEMKQAAQQGMSVLSQDKVSAKATAPIKVRDQVIGVLDAHKPTNELWTDEEVSLLETLTEQLGVALDSARLYQDVQRRAAREQLAGAITARMRESLDIERVLKTAADEMFQALPLDHIAIRLAPEETTPDEPPKGDEHGYLA